ncbi:MAG: sulfite exporter TauE/SafE family protein [Emcibacteraceae bacterium]|nr:sulfite exporter TauE/SafE family protein [Emcibacteraceae bacterium]
MNEFSEIIPLILVMLASGVLSGLMAGLLGIGGGIVIVPILEFSLSYFGVDEAVRMHVAIATSLAIIIVTSFSSARAHNKHENVDHALIKKWAVSMLIAAAIGSWVASMLNGKSLVIIFALLAFVVAFKMLLKGDPAKTGTQFPNHWAVQLMPLSIGGLSSMMGIGGGVMGVSFMTIFGMPIHRAVGTASFFGVLISIPGTISYMITGAGVEGLPAGNIGYVSLIGLGVIAPVSYLAAPFGAKIAHQLNQRQLNLAFGGFLLFVSSQMIYRYLF